MPTKSLCWTSWWHPSATAKSCKKHVAFLYAKGSVYHIENGCLLYHGAVPLTDEGEFAAETFEGHSLRGRALLDYCDLRARLGYFAPEGSPERQSGQDFLWYLWCGKLSPAVWPQRHDHL